MQQLQREQTAPQEDAEVLQLTTSPPTRTAVGAQESPTHRAAQQETHQGAIGYSGHGGDLGGQSGAAGGFSGGYGQGAYPDPPHAPPPRTSYSHHPGFVSGANSDDGSNEDQHDEGPPLTSVWDQGGQGRHTAQWASPVVVAQQGGSAIRPKPVSA